MPPFFSTPKQTVRVISEPPGASVAINDVEQTKRGQTPNKIRVKRRKGGEVRVHKDGYKDHFEILAPTKVNPLAYLSLFAFYIPYIVDVGTGSAFRLNKKEIHATLTKIPEKVEGSAPVLCNSLTFRIKGGDKIGNFYINGNSNEILYFGKSIDADADGLQQEVNSLFNDLGYTVPKSKSGKIFAATTGAKYYLQGDISKITYDVYASAFYSSNSKRYETKCVMEVSWKLIDRKKQTLLEKKTTGTSVKFEEGGSAVFTDAFENAFYLPAQHLGSPFAAARGYLQGLQWQRPLRKAKVGRPYQCRK